AACPVPENMPCRKLAHSLKKAFRPRNIAERKIVRDCGRPHLCVKPGPLGKCFNFRCKDEFAIALERIDRLHTHAITHNNEFWRNRSQVGNCDSEHAVQPSPSRLAPLKKRFKNDFSIRAGMKGMT